MVNVEVPGTRTLAQVEGAIRSAYGPGCEIRRKGNTRLNVRNGKLRVKVRVQSKGSGTRVTVVGRPPVGLVALFGALGVIISRRRGKAAWVRFEADVARVAQGARPTGPTSGTVTSFAAKSPAPAGAAPKPAVAFQRQQGR